MHWSLVSRLSSGEQRVGGQDKQNTSLQSCHITTNSKLFHARTGDWIFLRSFTMVSKYLQTRESDGKVEQLLLSIQRLSKSKSLWLYSRVVWAYNCLIVMLPNSGDTATPELAPGSSQWMKTPDPSHAWYLVRWDWNQGYASHQLQICFIDAVLEII